MTNRADILREEAITAWRAAYMTDRTRRAIRERRLVGESAESIAADYEVPVRWVKWLCAWQMFGDDPQPEYEAKP